MVDFKKFSDVDLYKLLGVEFTATEAEIRKSYRKKALVCHPDKNPDNPKAAETFHTLQNALAVLIDVSARSAYDRMLRAKKAHELRNKQLDSKRQKMKIDLEQREREAATNRTSYNGKSPEELFKAELDRIMKENETLMEEENQILRQQIYQERHRSQPATQPSWDSSKHRIKIKWNADKDDISNGGYNYENLTKFLSKYGDIVALLVSRKKMGSGIVEFKSQEAAEMAIAYEKGILENQLRLEWIGDAPKSRKPGGATVTETDYESLVLRQMRQAEERKRLIDQMMKDDEDDD